MFRPLLVSLGVLTAVCQPLEAQEILVDGNVIRIYGSAESDLCTVRKAFGDRLRIRIESYDAAADEWEDTTRTLDIYPSDEFDNVIVTFSGWEGDDTFYVEDPEDFADYDIVFDLFGGTGVDDLQGGPGLNYLWGGYDGDIDVLRGGVGMDVFVNGYVVRTYQVRRYNGPDVPPTITTYRTHQVERERHIDFNREDGDRIENVLIEF